MNALSGPSLPALQFSGQQTTLNATLKHHTGKQLKAALQQESEARAAQNLEADETVGQLPEALKNRLNLNEPQARALLDNLVVLLRERGQWSSQFLYNTWNEMYCRQVNRSNIFNQAPNLQKLGEGSFGRAYKLGNRDHAFKLKVFKRSAETPFVDVHEIPYEEAATGLFLTGRNTRDVAHFHFANPGKHWTLTEYIGHQKHLENRPGPTLASHRMAFSDQKPDNFIRNIRIDHGGAYSLPE